MKWIGQNVYDFISRFRNDVYLEDVSTGTIASGAHLGLDSNNKIVKAADGGGDLTSIVAGTGLSGTSLTGPIPTLNVDASQTQITSVGTIGTGSWRGDPIQTAYIGDDQVTEDKLANTLLAEIDANTAKVTNVATNLTATTHASQITINSSDGTNVVVAEASGSIAGVMSVTHHDKLDAIEASATADQSKSDIDGLAITTVGTIDTGTWQGTRVASLYLDADTAHLTTDQTFSGVKTFDETIVGSINGSAATVATITGLAPNTATTQASQPNITGVGTIGTGVWQGTTIKTAYIGDDQITEDKLANTLLAEIDANTAKVTNSDQSKADINALDITEVGTISSGVWNGTAIASAYLDADTMHYSAQRQLTHHTIQDDIDTQVVFLSLTDFDSENTTISNNKLPLIAPVAGKLLKVFVRCSHNLSGVDFTWKLYTRTSSQSTNGNAAEIGAQTGTGPTNGNMVTYDFTTGLDSGTNAIGAGDKVQISLETNGSTSNANFFITLMWEWDLS